MKGRAVNHELDALLIRSLPEINEAAVRLDELQQMIFKAVDADIEDWIKRNDWQGVAEWFGDAGETWLAPKEWMYLGGADGSAYLRFDFGSPTLTEDYWYLASFTGSGQRQLGLKICCPSIKKKLVFRRIWKSFLSKSTGLPLYESEFFLPVILDREALAAAVLNGSVSEALGPLRETLDRLPQLASELESLKKAVAAAAEAAEGSRPPAPT